MNNILLGSHVGMSGKDMFLGSVNEALSYGANTFMVYTGAPQNTIRKDVALLNIPNAVKQMKDNGIGHFIVHAPYIINLGNTVKPEIFKLGVDFLTVELMRSAAMGADTVVLHPGSAVGAERSVGLKSIIDGLNEVFDRASSGEFYASDILTGEKKSAPIKIALETMAGKGSELGCTFEELYEIFNGVKDNSRLGVCFDTCHVSDAGYNVKENFDGVIGEFEKFFNKSVIDAFHINDSMNPQGAHKDRHANIGEGSIGYDTLKYIVHHKDFSNVPKILETPYRKVVINGKEDSQAPYKEEIAWLLK